MPLTFWFDPFERLGQKSVKGNVLYLEDLKTPKNNSEINWPLVGASFEGLSVVIEGYQRPTMKLLDDMKTLLNDSETVALIVKFSNMIIG